jgi:hypothetical protein
MGVLRELTLKVQFSEAGWESRHPYDADRPGGNDRSTQEAQIEQIGEARFLEIGNGSKSIFWDSAPHGGFAASAASELEDIAQDAEFGV